MTTEEKNKLETISKRSTKSRYSSISDTEGNYNTEKYKKLAKKLSKDKSELKEKVRILLSELEIKTKHNVIDLEKTEQYYRDQINSLKDQKDKEKKNAKDLEKNIEKIKRQLHEKDQLFKDQEQHNLSLISNLEKDIEKYKLENQNIHNKILSVESEKELLLDKFKNEKENILNTNKKEIERIRGEFDMKIRSDYTSKNVEKNLKIQFESQITGLQLQIKEKDNIINTIQNKLLDTEKKVYEKEAQLKEIILSTQKQITENSENISNLQDQNKQYKEIIKKIGDESQTINNQFLINFNKYKQEFEKELNLKNDLVNSLTLKLNEVEKEKDEITSKFNNFICDVKTKNQDKEQNIKNIETNLSENNKIIDAQNKKIQYLLDLTNNIQCQSDSYRDKAVFYENEFNQIKNFRAQVENEKKFILDAHNELKESFISKLNYQKELFEKDLCENIKEKEKINHELSNTTSLYQKVLNELDILSGKNIILSEDIKTKNNHIIELEKRISLLSEKIKILINMISDKKQTDFIVNETVLEIEKN